MATRARKASPVAAPVDPTKVDVTCSLCGKTARAKPKLDGTGRLPQGWLALPGEKLCGKCRDERYLRRAVALPVAAVVGAVGEEKFGWKEFEALLKPAWQQSTALSNWAVTELRARDVQRRPGETGPMPPMKAVYLYPDAVRQFPGMASQSLNSVLHAVERRWRKQRYFVSWKRDQSLPSYKYPTPYPVHNDGWTSSWGPGPDRVPHVSFRLGGKRVTLRLRSNASLKRQLKGFAILNDNHHLAGELSVYRVKAHPGDRRQAGTQAGKGGGPTTHWRIMVKIAGWLPRQGRRTDLKGSMYLKLEPDRFWTASVSGREEPWHINADHVKRWVDNHRVFLQRVADDTKHELRMPRRNKKQLLAHVRERCTKYKRRINTFLDTITKMLAGLAERQGVALVEYDNVPKGYFEGEKGDKFPYYQLTELLRRKLHERGIRLVCAKDEDAQEEEDEVYEAGDD
jgi:hypothetical protein